MLSLPQLNKAKRLNKKYSKELVWNKRLIETTVFGNDSNCLTEEAFINKIAEWQKNNGFVLWDCDGIIGPNTFSFMLIKFPKLQNAIYDNFINKLEEFIISNPNIANSKPHNNSSQIPVMLSSLFDIIEDAEKALPKLENLAYQKALSNISKAPGKIKLKSIYSFAKFFKLLSTEKSNVALWQKLLKGSSIVSYTLNIAGPVISTGRIAYEIKKDTWDAHTAVNALSTIGGIGVLVLNTANPIAWIGAAVFFGYAIYDFNGKASDDIDEYLGKNSLFGQMLKRNSSNIEPVKSLRNNDLQGLINEDIQFKKGIGHY